MRMLRGRKLIHPLIGFLTLPTVVVIGSSLSRIEKAKCWGAVVSALGMAVLLVANVFTNFRGTPAEVKLLGLVVFFIFFAYQYFSETFRDYEVKPLFGALLGAASLVVAAVSIFFLAKKGYNPFPVGTSALAGFIGSHIYLVLTGKHYRVNGDCVILDKEVEEK